MLNRKLGVALLTASVVFAATGVATAGSGYGSKAKAASTQNIVKTAVAAGSFTTLVKAVKAAGLEQTLTGKGPFTVLAPTDAAFAGLPAGALEGLLKDKAKLKAVLLNHVVSGDAPSGAVVKLASVKTVGGAEWPVDATDGVRIADAKVVQADVRASNGVIHVIDKVLLAN